MVFRHIFVAIFTIAAVLLFLRDWNIRAQEHELKPIPVNSQKSVETRCPPTKVTERELDCLISEASDSSYGFIKLTDVKRCLKNRFEEE